MAWRARYELHWGHKVSVGRNQQEEVTRAEYNEAAGWDTPPQPEIPVCGQHVIDWWEELNARRPPGFDSLVPFSCTEIRSWIELTGRSVTYTDIRWLVQIDDAWVLAIGQEREAKRQRDEEEAERNRERNRGKRR